MAQPNNLLDIREMGIECHWAIMAVAMEAYEYRKHLERTSPRISVPGDKKSSYSVRLGAGIFSNVISKAQIEDQKTQGVQYTAQHLFDVLSEAALLGDQSQYWQLAISAPTTATCEKFQEMGLALAKYLANTAPANVRPEVYESLAFKVSRPLRRVIGASADVSHLADTPLPPFVRTAVERVNLGSRHLNRDLVVELCRAAISCHEMTAPKSYDCGIYYGCDGLRHRSVYRVVDTKTSQAYWVTPAVLAQVMCARDENQLDILRQGSFEFTKPLDVSQAYFTALLAKGQPRFRVAQVVSQSPAPMLDQTNTGERIRVRTPDVLLRVPIDETSLANLVLAYTHASCILPDEDYLRATATRAAEQYGEVIPGTVVCIGPYGRADGNVPVYGKHEVPVVATIVSPEQHDPYQSITIPASIRYTFREDGGHNTWFSFPRLLLGSPKQQPGAQNPVPMKVIQLGRRFDDHDLPEWHPVQIRTSELLKATAVVVGAALEEPVRMTPTTPMSYLTAAPNLASAMHYAGSSNGMSYLTYLAAGGRRQWDTPTEGGCKQCTGPGDVRKPSTPPYTHYTARLIRGQPYPPPAARRGLGGTLRARELALHW